jgi:hypothetical protein
MIRSTSFPNVAAKRGNVRLEDTTASRLNDSLDFLSQRSREARQRWAGGHNRFPVE